MIQFSRFSLSILFVFGSFVISAFAQNDVGWRPINQAELDMKTPQVETDADAEAIFWEISLDDKKRKKLFYNHYVRVKIFTERGREKFSKVDIPFTKGKTVEEVAARVIKPDGTIIELKASEVFEREIIKYGKYSILAKSFALPGIAPGVIIEYKYKETFKNDSAEGERLVFQRDIPMQRVTYYIRPFEGMYLNFDYRNMPEIKFTANSEGFYVGTIQNVPAFKEEPNMPPEDEVIKWAQLSYRGRSFDWSPFGRAVNQIFSNAIKPTKEIEQKVAELTNGVSSSDEKLKKIYDFTRTQIRNITFDASLTDEQKEKIEIKGATDALKKRMGHIGDINFLFAALAKASGFQTALVLASDRSESFFNPDRNIQESNIHPAGIIIIQGNGESKFVNAGNPYLPYGKLQWFEEGSYAMVAGETGFVWKKLPVSPYIESPATRTGKFKLLEDGTLEGTVKLEFDGHQAISRRMGEFKNSPAKREENIKEEIKENLTTAEISEVSINNFDDPSKPLTYIFKIRVPNYAAKTGKRLFLQPGVFEYGAKPRFSTATRTYPIYFNYPWFEDDTIEIELPKTFLPDNAGSPGNVAEGKNIGSLITDISIDKTTNLLKYKRRFYFGNGILFFPAKTYPALKTLFDNFQKSDAHTITLKQSGE